MRCTLETRCNEHKRRFSLGHRKQLALAEHEWGTAHEILFSQAVRIFETDQWSAQLVYEVLAYVWSLVL